MLSAVILVTFFVFVVIGLPICLSLAFGAIIPMEFVMHSDLIVLAQKMFTSTDSFSLMAIPFFILAGEIMGRGGVSKRIVAFVNSLFCWMPGSMAVVTFFASAFFGAISGSATATVAAIGSLMLPAMLKNHYEKGFAVATIAAAGILGTIIPPSISFVVFGNATGAPIGDMFMGGIIPGLLLACAMAAYGVYYGIKHPETKSQEKFTLGGVWKALKYSFLALLMPVIILGSIYAGIATPTEAAAVAIFYGLIVSIFVYRELNLKDLLKAIVASAQTTAMIMFIIACATAFAYVMTIARIPTNIANALSAASSTKLIFWALVTLILLIVGMVMDTQPAVLILSPILIITARVLGIGDIQFGVVMCINLAIGLLTPPVGMNLFVAASVAKEPVKVSINRHLWVYIILSFVVLILLMAVPQLIEFLPSIASTKS